MVSDQYARTNAWQPQRGSPSSISATGSASCALTSLPKRWSPCRGPSQSPFPPRWFWSLAVVGGTEIRQTLLLRLVNPCLFGLEIPIPIPEILAWARSHHRAPSWKLTVKAGTGWSAEEAMGEDVDTVFLLRDGRTREPLPSQVATPFHVAVREDLFIDQRHACGSQRLPRRALHRVPRRALPRGARGTRGSASIPLV